MIRTRLPKASVGGYSAKFVRERFEDGKTRRVEVSWLTGHLEYPPLTGGWFMWTWEPAHQFYLGISKQDWDCRLDRREMMAAELWLQCRIWLPDNYPFGVAVEHYPHQFEDWADRVRLKLHQKMDARTYLNRPYGPSESMREAGAYWRSFLLAKGWPIPTYKPYPVMPLLPRDWGDPNAPSDCPEDGL